MKTIIKVQYLILLIVSLLISSCGKKGPVEPLEESKYPRTYPKPPPQDQFPQKKPRQKESPNDA